jgi:hypothetical protein
MLKQLQSYFREIQNGHIDPLETNASSLENAFKAAASLSPNYVPLYHALLEV